MNQLPLNSSLRKKASSTFSPLSYIYEGMRDRMERFVVLPFTMGCVSQSSIEVGTDPPKKSKTTSDPVAVSKRHEGDEERICKVRIKKSWGYFSFGMHKLIIRSFKSFSQLFVYKEDSEEMEREIEIGYPTDVKHVTHIGWDGSSSTNPVKGWENLKTPEILSFPSISLKQLELAMAAQAEHGVPPPIGGASATSAHYTLS